MQPYHIEIKPSVTMRLNSLSQPERDEVMSDIDHLVADPFPPGAPNTYPAAGSLDGESGKVFVLKTLGRLRVLYTVKPDRTILVMTIANQDLADRYFRPEPGGGRMKTLDPFSFSHAAASAELDDFRALLDSKVELSERNDVLPFFRQHQHLSLLIGSASLNVSGLDRLAFEYDLFGDFACDVVMGDSRRNAYAFVEFEDARAASVFRVGEKYTHEWGRRFEHGFSQIVDWFWKLDDQSKTSEFRNRFGAQDARFSALLVIGRNEFLPPRERQRLNWRLDRVLINSNKVSCLTFDDLYVDLRDQLASLALLAK